MTPKTDSVAVLREMLGPTGPDHLRDDERAAIEAGIAALSAQGAARPIGYLTIGKFDGEFSFPPTREYSFKAIQRDLGNGRFPVYLSPGGVGDAVTEDALQPLRAWWAFIEAGRELDGDPPLSDADVILSYAGNGASTMVTAGQLRAALAARGTGGK